MQIVQDADNSDWSDRLTRGLTLLSITAGMNYGVVLATTRTVIKNHRGDSAHTCHSLYEFMTGLCLCHHCPEFAPAPGSHKGLECTGETKAGVRRVCSRWALGASLRSCSRASHILTQHKASNRFTSLKTELEAFDVTLVGTHTHTHTHTHSLSLSLTHKCRRARSLRLSHSER